MKTFKLDKEAIFNHLKSKEGVIAVKFPETDEIYEDCSLSIYVLYDPNVGEGTTHQRGISTALELEDYLYPEDLDSGVPLIFRSKDMFTDFLDEEDINIWKV